MTLTDKANLAFAASGQQAFRVATRRDTAASACQRTQRFITPGNSRAICERESVLLGRDTVGDISTHIEESTTANSLEERQPSGRPKVR